MLPRQLMPGEFLRKVGIVELMLRVRIVGKRIDNIRSSVRMGRGCLLQCMRYVEIIVVIESVEYA